MTRTKAEAPFPDCPSHCTASSHSSRIQAIMLAKRMDASTARVWRSLMYSSRKKTRRLLPAASGAVSLPTAASAAAVFSSGLPILFDLRFWLQSAAPELWRGAQHCCPPAARVGVGAPHRVCPQLNDTRTKLISIWRSTHKESGREQEAVAQPSRQQLCWQSNYIHRDLLSKRCELAIPLPAGHAAPTAAPGPVGNGHLINVLLEVPTN